MGKIVPFRKPRRTSRWTRAKAYVAPPFARRRGASGPRWFPLAMVALPLAAFTAVMLAPLGGGPVEAQGAAALPAPREFDDPAALDAAQPDTAAFAVPSSGAALTGGARDTERARFALCSGAVRMTCVVDGDTIWYRGEKIRLADLDTPEVFSPGCAQEAALGRRATARMQALLNAGPFTLEPNPDGAARDRYGRRLMLATREGESLGAVLVREGLAEAWGGPRRAWC